MKPAITESPKPALPALPVTAGPASVPQSTSTRAVAWLMDEVIPDPRDKDQSRAGPFARRVFSSWTSGGRCGDQ